MPCHEVRKTLLYFSGEMNSREISKFRKHVKTCSFCRDEIKVLKMAGKAFRNATDVPDDRIRRHILLEASRRVNRQGSSGDQPASWLRTLAWGIPALAAVMVVFLLLHTIGDRHRFNEDLTEWRDDFFVQTYDLAVEMDAFFSNHSMSVNMPDEDDAFLLDDISLLSGEFNSIRSQIQDLFENMAGI